jgi:hypothetical protein
MQLIWVPGYAGIERNEISDQHAGTRCEHPVTGSVLDFGLSQKVSKRAIREWMTRKH